MLTKLQATTIKLKPPITHKTHFKTYKKSYMNINHLGNYSELIVIYRVI